MIDGSTGNVEALVGSAKHGAAFAANSSRNRADPVPLKNIQGIGDCHEITVGQIGPEGRVQPQMLRASLRRAIDRSARRRWRSGIASGHTGVEIQSQEHLIERAPHPHRCAFC